MKILNCRTLAGPNVYHHRPVLVATLALEALHDRETREFDGLHQRLIAHLPGLREHRCSRGHPGGFLERLAEGTYFAHLVEHVALELSAPAGIQVGFGKARWAADPDLYHVIVRYKSEDGMRRVLEIAVELVEACIAGADYPLDPELERVRRIVEDGQLGPSTRAIVEAAEARGLPWRRLNHRSLVQIGYGAESRLIQAALTGATSHIGVEIAQDKEATKQMLRDAGIAAPRGFVATSLDDAVDAFRRVGPPVAVKPIDGHQGKGITLDVTGEAELAAAFESAAAYSRYGDVLIEEMVQGRDYRVLVVKGRMVAAAERRPAAVVGDGLHAVRELVEIENMKSKRGVGHTRALSRIRLGASTERSLARQGLTLDSVPDAGRHVQLSETANLSTGGTAADVTDLVHPDVRHTCERAARVVGLDICGVDLVSRDISRPGGGIVELNAAPGLRMHVAPSEGVARSVGAAIVEALFPQHRRGRVPVVSITGTNGKTTTTRMLAHILGLSGRTVGMTTSDGVWIAGRCVARGDTTGPKSAQMVLFDRDVQLAVLETARGGIMRRGLGYDWADVGVITNVQADHIGQDGLETLEDIAHVKELVAERVHPGGTLVLNADDPLVRAFARHAEGRRLAFFGLRPFELPAGADGAAEVVFYTVRDGCIVETRAGGIEERIAPIAEVPQTMLGTATVHIYNALAAAAAARACRLPAAAVSTGLRTFTPALHNPGRLNLFRVNGGYLVLDYGHNPAGIEAMGRFVRQWSGFRSTGIVEAPGDRADWIIQELGQEAARAFDQVMCYEPEDLRGRRPGEVPGILCRAVSQAVPGKHCRVILRSADALRTALAEMQAGDLVVYFYDNYHEARAILDAQGAVAVRTIVPPQTEEHRERARA